MSIIKTTVECNTDRAMTMHKTAKRMGLESSYITAGEDVLHVTVKCEDSDYHEWRAMEAWASVAAVLLKFGMIREV